MSRISTLNDRQRECLNTCLGSCQNISYPTLLIYEELGEMTEKLLPLLEFNEQLKGEREHITQLLNGIRHNCMCLGKLAKAVRHQSIPQPFRLQSNIPDDVLETLLQEFGDMTWAYNVAIKQLGADAQQIADLNLAKLSRRKAEGTIDGKGDKVRTSIDE